MKYNEKENFNSGIYDSDVRRGLFARLNIFKLGVFRYAFRIFTFFFGIALITLLSKTVLASGPTLIYERHTTNLFRWDASNPTFGPAFTVGAGNRTLIDMSELTDTPVITMLTATGTDTSANNNNGTPNVKAVIFDENDLAVATSTNIVSMRSYDGYLFMWYFSTTTLPSKFSIDFYYDNIQDEDHIGLHNLYIYGALATNPLGENYINLDIPSTGQSVSDFPFWTISAQTSYPSSTIQIIYYDSYGGYHNDVLNGDFSSATLLQANYPKTYALHNGPWRASARIMSSSSVVLATSPWSNFTVTSQAIATTTTEFYKLDNCTSAGVTDGGFLSSLSCNALNTMKGAINSLKAGMDIMVYNIGQLVVAIFPINVFSHINADFDTAKNSTTTTNVALTSANPNNFFYGADMILLSSSTVGKIYEGSGFSIRTFLTYLMFALLGVIMVITAMATVKSLKDKA